MSNTSVFKDLSVNFLNENISLNFTRARILTQIRESIISPIVVRASKDVFLSFYEKYKKNAFEFGQNIIEITTKLGDKPITLVFDVYNAKTRDELEDKQPNMFTGSSSFRYNGNIVFINVFVGLINGVASEDKIFSLRGIISHELNHIYQQFCRESSFGHDGLMLVAKSNLFSPDINSYYLGVIAYVGDNSERQSFCNELYSGIMNYFENNVRFEKENCPAYIWLNNLEKAYQYLLTNKGNVDLKLSIKNFKDNTSLRLYNLDDKTNLERTGRKHLSDENKWTYGKLKNVANNTIHKFENEIRQTIGKAINDALERGIIPRTNGYDYFSLFL